MAGSMLPNHPNTTPPIGQFGDSSGGITDFGMFTNESEASWMTMFGIQRLPVLHTPSVMSMQTEDGGSLDLAAAINWLHSSINHLNYMHGQLAQERASADQDASRLGALEESVEQLTKELEELREQPLHGRAKQSKACDTPLAVSISV